jgi:hypothetical protein
VNDFVIIRTPTQYDIKDGETTRTVGQATPASGLPGANTNAAGQVNPATDTPGFSLPSISGLATGATSIANNLVNYSTASAGTLISNATGALTGSLGRNLGQFSSLIGTQLMPNMTAQVSQMAGKAAAGLLNSGISSVKDISGAVMGGVPGQIGAMESNLMCMPSAADTQKSKYGSDFFVKLTSTISNQVVMFNVTPTITEKRSADYAGVDIIHHPGQIQKWRTTRARDWSMQAKLISRTTGEATKNQEIIQVIRSWVMPYYGYGTGKDTQLKSKLGAPPDILILEAYGDRNIGPLPVVLTSYSWEWPQEYDYIPTTSGDPFPVLINISLDLLEAYSPREYSNFSLADYRIGNLSKAFSNAPITDQEGAIQGQSGATGSDAVVPSVDAGTTPQVASPVSEIMGPPSPSVAEGAVKDNAAGAISSQSSNPVFTIQRDGGRSLDTPNAPVFDIIRNGSRSTGSDPQFQINRTGSRRTS